MKEGLNLVSLRPSLSRNGRLSHLWLSLDPAQGGFGVRRRAELGSSLLREPPRTELHRCQLGERGGASRTRGHSPALRSPSPTPTPRLPGCAVGAGGPGSCAAAPLPPGPRPRALPSGRRKRRKEERLEEGRGRQSRRGGGGSGAGSRGGERRGG